MNRFLEKFEGKNTADLEEILVNKKAYTEEAREAALKILQEREVRSDQILELEAEEKERKKQEQLDLKREIEAHNGKGFFDDLEIETLYSKNAIIAFSLFFSPIHGSMLLGYNLKTIDRKNTMYVLIIISVFSTLFIDWIFDYFLSDEVSYFLGLLFNVVAGMIFTRFFWPKLLGENVNYNSKSIVFPLVLSLSIVVVYYLIYVFWDQLIYGV